MKIERECVLLWSPVNAFACLNIQSGRTVILKRFMLEMARNRKRNPHAKIHATDKCEFALLQLPGILNYSTQIV